MSTSIYGNLLSSTVISKGIKVSNAGSRVIYYIIS